MVSIKPSLELNCNKLDHGFVIVSFAMHPEFGTPAACGKFARVSAAQMQNNGVNILLNDLRGFRNRIYERGEMSSLTDEQKTEFDRLHDHIIVRLIASDVLTLSPLHPEPAKRGYTSRPEEALHVKLPIDAKDFWDELHRAFKMCE